MPFFHVCPKSTCCSCVFRGWPAQSAVRFLTIFWFPFPLWLSLLKDWALLDGGLCFFFSPPFFLLPSPAIPLYHSYCEVVLPQSNWVYLGLPFILLLMAQQGHWFFCYITGGLLCPICFSLGVSGLFASFGLPRPFS